VANREGWIQSELKYGLSPGAFGSYQMEPRRAFGRDDIEYAWAALAQSQANRAECKLANGRGMPIDG